MDYREENRGIGDLLGDLGRQVSTLVRKEIDLARVEVTSSVGRMSRGAAMAGAGGAIGGGRPRGGQGYGGGGGFGGGQGYGGSGNATPSFGAARARNNHLVLAVGDRVSHDKYGLGTVLETKGSGPTATVTVDFGSAGKVRLMLIGGVPMVKL